MITERDGETDRQVEGERDRQRGDTGGDGGLGTDRQTRQTDLVVERQTDTERWGAGWGRHSQRQKRGGARERRKGDRQWRLRRSEIQREGWTQREREMWETDRQRKMERETLAERERHIHKETDRDGDMEMETWKVGRDRDIWRERHERGRG